MLKSEHAVVCKRKYYLLFLKLVNNEKGKVEFLKLQNLDLSGVQNVNILDTHQLIQEAELYAVKCCLTLIIMAVI